MTSARQLIEQSIKEEDEVQANFMSTRNMVDFIHKMLLVRKGEVLTEQICKERANNITEALHPEIFLL